MKDDGISRVSETGANRDTSMGKLDFEAAISPLVLMAYLEYITKHAKRPDGTYRELDNWQLLFGTHEEHRNICIKSAYRHFIDLLMEHDGYDSREGIDEALGGLLFNIMCYWFSILKERREKEKNK